MKKGWKITLLFSGTAVFSGIVFLISKYRQPALPAEVFLAATMIFIGIGVASGIIQIIEFGKDNNNQGEDRRDIIVIAGQVSHSLCSGTMTQTVGRLNMKPTEIISGIRNKSDMDSNQLLSQREREVVNLLLQGKSNKQIAMLLNVSELPLNSTYIIFSQK